MNKAVWYCTPKCDEDGDDKKVYCVKHFNKQSEFKTMYTVVHKIADETFHCTCNNFIRNAILCRHVFSVMIHEQVAVIPEKYILRRWRRGLVPVEIMPAHARYGEMDVEKQGMMNKAVSVFDFIVGMVQNDKGMLAKFVEQLEDLGEQISMDIPLVSSYQKKHDDIEEFIGASQPESVDILPPSGIRNKGCGTGKRLVGASEKTANNAKKPKRLCRHCHKMARHDSRNCPEKGLC